MRPAFPDAGQLPDASTSKQPAARRREGSAMNDVQETALPSEASEKNVFALFNPCCCEGLRDVVLSMIIKLLVLDVDRSRFGVGELTDELVVDWCCYLSYVVALIY